MPRPNSGARSSRPDYTVAELFCGCGGFSHGFKLTNRFRVVFGNDVKRFALRSFEINHTENGNPPAALQRDIRSVSDRELTKLLEKHKVSSLDCLVGGPPCQGCSR